MDELGGEFGGVLGVSFLLGDWEDELMTVWLGIID